MSFDRMLRDLKAELRGMLGRLIRRGEIALANEEYGIQVKGFSGDEEGEDAEEQFNDVELWQQYGIASRPPADSEVLLANLMGLSENAVAFATNSATDRPADLADGEVVTYGKAVAAGQAQVRHEPDGTLSLACATGKFVEVGGADAKLIKGEAYNSALQGWLTKVSALLSAAGPVAGDPTLATDYTTMCSQMTAALATKGKVS